VGSIKEPLHSVLGKAFEPLAHRFFIHAQRLRNLWNDLSLIRQMDDLGALHQPRLFGAGLTPLLDRFGFFFRQCSQVQRHA